MNWDWNFQASKKLQNTIEPFQFVKLDESDWFGSQAQLTDSGIQLQQLIVLQGKIISE